VKEQSGFDEPVFAACPLAPTLTVLKAVAMSGLTCCRRGPDLPSLAPGQARKPVCVYVGLDPECG